MINRIIETISVSLHEKFGDGYEIHMESIKQDLKEPCFFIFTLEPTTKQFMGRRYFQERPFCIQYFPSTEDVQHECNEVAEQLTWLLEYIKADGLMRGTKMRWEVMDGVLSFFVNYDGFVDRIPEITDPMESLESGFHAGGE